MQVPLMQGILMKNNSSVFGGVLLVGGTCIGAGMLGLPIVTAAAGFFPTLGAFLLVWFFMTCSALAYLEVTLRFKGEINLISLAGNTLGKGAKAFAWVVYVLFLYSLMAAYTAGGTSIFAQSVDIVPTTRLEAGIISLVFAFPFALIVYYGPYWVDHLNRVLMYGLILTFAYICVVFFRIIPEHEFHAVGSSKYLLFTLPLLVTSFGYHTLIPTLKTYMQENVKKLRIVIIVGSLLPFVVYALWELIILFLIPTWGDYGLVSMMHSNANPGDAMAAAISLHGKHLHICVVLFIFFALTSSFIGVGLGIFDFFSDGLRIHKTKYGRLILTLLTFGPPIIYTMLLPEGFLAALSYAGVFAAILLIIYPVLMAWHARYIKKLPGTYRLWGGKTMLGLTLLFGIFVMFSDILERMGLFPKQQGSKYLLVIPTILR